MLGRQLQFRVLVFFFKGLQSLRIQLLGLRVRGTFEIHKIVGSLGRESATADCGRIFVLVFRVYGLGIKCPNKSSGVS